MEKIEKEELNELKEIREMWAELNQRLTHLEEETVNEGKRVSSQKIKSAQENLAAYYRRFSRAAFMCAVVFPIVYGIPHGVIEYPSLLYHLIVAGACLIFFLSGGIMDLYLYNGVMDINLVNMPVSEVRRSAIGLKKMHHIFQMILIPLAIVTLGIMMYPILYQVWIGAVFGAVVGLAIGINAYRKMMRDYKELIHGEDED